MSDQDRPGESALGADPDDSWSVPMPQQLQRAVRLMAAAGLLTLVTIPFIVGSRQTMREEAHAGLGADMTTTEIDSMVDTIVTLGVIGTVVVASLWLAMAYLNKRGKAWARLTSLALGALFCLVMVWYGTAVLLPAGAAIFTLPNLLSLLVLAIAVVVLVYLWSPPVRDWFDQQRRVSE